MFARTRESLSHSSLSDARFATLSAAWRRSITTAQSSRTWCTITLRSFRSSLNVPSVFKPQAVPSSEIALFGQRNVHHLEVSTICRAECSSRNVARVGSSELSIPFQSSLYSASPVAVRTFVPDFPGVRPTRSSPRGESADRPRNTCTCIARCGLSFRAGQLATRFSPAPWPNLSCMVTASGRRLRLQTAGDTAFDFRGARPARSSPRQESADRPRSTCACNAQCVRFPRRAARALIAVWRTGRPPTEHACVHCAVRTWLWCGETRDAILPSSLAIARLHGHRIKSAAAASNRR